MTIRLLKNYAKNLRRTGRARTLVSVLQFGWNQWKNARDYLNSQNIVTNFEKKASGKDVPGLVDLMLNGFDGVLAPIQNPRELERWLRRVEDIRPEVVVEIGTAKGGTFLLLSRVAASGATMISIDLPGGYYGGGYAGWKEEFFRKLIGPDKETFFIRANSHDRSTREQLEQILGGRKIDVLFIDGDHSYAGAKSDFLQYSPLVRSGGLIGIHDILHNRFDPDIDVYRLWNEIKKDYTVEEIVDRPDQGNLGIGIVQVSATGAAQSKNPPELKMQA
ncbi:MAG TPA: class I SAM-dependent methyltransferase [Roseiarcus sp.]|nr:class I SAM-dependent methyltransferase [Roseiarcus sp.]